MDQLEARVCGVVEELLKGRYGLPLRRLTTIEPYCDMCGSLQEQNLDIYGGHNGYKTHSVGTCIKNLQEKVASLEQQVDSLRLRHEGCNDP